MKKNILYFILGMIFVLGLNTLASQLKIETNLDNALIYIKKILLTDNGKPNGNKTIMISGEDGDIVMSGTLIVKTDAILPGGSINTYEIANGAVTKDKLADNSVNSSKIVDNSITAADLAANSVGASELKENDSYNIRGLTINGDGGLELKNTNDSVSYIDFKGKNNQNVDYIGRIKFDDNNRKLTINGTNQVEIGDGKLLSVD